MGFTHYIFQQRQAGQRFGNHSEIEATIQNGFQLRNIVIESRLIHQQNGMTDSRRLQCRIDFLKVELFSLFHSADPLRSLIRFALIRMLLSFSRNRKRIVEKAGQGTNVWILTQARHKTKILFTF